MNNGALKAKQWMQIASNCQTLQRLQALFSKFNIVFNLQTTLGRLYSEIDAAEIEEVRLLISKVISEESEGGG